MPTKRAVLAELTRAELRANLDHYELAVDDRRVSAQLVDALARSRKARLDEMLLRLSRNRLKELCRVFGLDDAGKKGGEFYTPRMVVRLIVELLALTERVRICDPTAGAGSMLIECAHYIERKGDNPRNLTLHSQEKNLTWIPR